MGMAKGKSHSCERCGQLHSTGSGSLSAQAWKKAITSEQEAVHPLEKHRYCGNLGKTEPLYLVACSKITFNAITKYIKYILS